MATLPPSPYSHPHAVRDYDECDFCFEPVDKGRTACTRPECVHENQMPWYSYQ